MTLSIRSLIFRLLDRRTPVGKIRRAYVAVDRHEQQQAALQKFLHFQQRGAVSRH